MHHDANEVHHFMTRRNRRVMQVVIGLAALTGLILSTGATTGASGRPAVKRYTDSEISFQYPAQWNIRHFNERSSFSIPIVFVSNETLHAPCRSFKVAAGEETTCNYPVKHLAKGGVLLEWTSNGTPTFSINQVPGIAGKIGGLVSRLEVARPGTCHNIGADETITAIADRPSPTDNFFELSACLRGPHLSTLADEVTSLLHSTTFPGTDPS
jgi:hypothetical protein